MGNFLRILFGCHARPDRSFYFRQKQFPICARCTGELVGMISGVIWILLVGVWNIGWYFLMMIPMILDGFCQQLTQYESNNAKRFLTGFLFGIAFDGVLVWIHIGTVHLAGWVLNTYWIHDLERTRTLMEILI